MRVNKLNKKGLRGRYMKRVQVTEKTFKKTLLIRILREGLGGISQW